MKKAATIFTAGVFIVVLSSGAAMAGNMNHDAHGTGTMGEMSSGKTMDHSGSMGYNIHNATIDNYRFTYHLLDMREQLKKMKQTGSTHQMEQTHHLMVTLRDPHGNVIESAKVGYLVEGPDGAKQKLMCMGMSGGYGADVVLKTPGVYTVKTKAVFEGKKMVDKFTYTVNES